jgi:hypothetical protein
MGTDQATYVEGPTAYGHEAEAFTPPWLLDGSIRPVITRSVHYFALICHRFSVFQPESLPMDPCLPSLTLDQWIKSVL